MAVMEIIQYLAVGRHTAHILWPEACRSASSANVLLMWKFPSISGKTKELDCSKSLAKKTMGDKAS